VCKTFFPAYSSAKIIKIERVFQSYNVKCTATFFFGTQCTVVWPRPRRLLATATGLHSCNSHIIMHCASVRRPTQQNTYAYCMMLTNCYSPLLYMYMTYCFGLCSCSIVTNITSRLGQVVCRCQYPSSPRRPDDTRRK